MKPSDKLCAWSRERAQERIMGCAAMLHYHGFITDAERKKVRRRIQRWLDEAQGIPQRDPAKEGTP